MAARYESPWVFSDNAITHAIYSKGTGPNVVVLHEAPGLIRECLDLGVILSEKVPARVHLPLLFGDPRPGFYGRQVNALQICLSKEIHAFAAKKTSPLLSWLRALCRKLKSESGDPGVGVVGKCLTGGFALTLVADDSVLASIVAQPSLPLFVHRADLGMSDDDAKDVKARTDALGETCVLGLRFQRDWICPRVRMNAISNLIGGSFEYFELPGSGHATLTLDCHPRALEKSILFLRARLHSARELPRRDK